MQTVLHAEPLAVVGALTRLGLTDEPLLAAAMEGYLARINCTANHPPLFPSFVAWGETVRALRDHLATEGWRRNDEKNYSRVVNADGNIGISVATGNEATGLADQSPSTKSTKGPTTIEALEVNQQLWLQGLEPEPSTAEGSDDGEKPQMTTWVLVVHHARNEIRAELSLPFSIGDDGRVSVWRERIMLRPIPLDPEPIEMVPPAQPSIDVIIRRKT
jgi:hypothetical protein